jgi:hypothetical protein
MNFFFITALCDALRVHFGQEAADWTKLMFQAPMLVRNDYRSGSGGLMRGNPLDLRTFTSIYTNPSGIPNTSWLAKFAGACYIYLACWYAGAYDGSDESIRSFLDGSGPVKLLNLGDNNITFTDIDVYADVATRPWRYMPFAILEPSDTFAGYVVLRDVRGGIELLRNIATYVKNILTPDRTMGHPMKGNWAVSLPIKRELYGDHPLFEQVDTVLNQAVLSNLGSTLQELADATPVKALPVRGMNLTDIDFLNNPESIEYKYTMADIDPGLLELFYITGTREDSERIMSAFTGG